MALTLEQVEDLSKSNGELEKEQLVDMYKKVYPLILRDFVHKEDLKEFIGDLLNSIYYCGIESLQWDDMLKVELKEEAGLALVNPDLITEPDDRFGQLSISLNNERLDFPEESTSRIKPLTPEYDQG